VSTFTECISHPANSLDELTVAVRQLRFGQDAPIDVLRRRAGNDIGHERCHVVGKGGTARSARIATELL
jgi:hypothetical protein